MDIFDLQAKITLDGSKYTSAISKMSKSGETLKKSLSGAGKESTTTKNKLKVLSAQYESAQKNVKKLTKEFNDAVQKEGATSKKAIELAKALDKAEHEADDLDKELKSYNKTASSSSKITSALGDKLKTGLKAGAAAVGTAMAAAGAAIVKIGKQAYEYYGEYEQLVGGVETLFKDSAPQVVKYASEAYKTAQLSANEYMDTVTSFSASLLQSLGGDTEKASAVANQAVVDMSDNANKMGTDIGAIQWAYQGFAKQNYTMLDNLKLGYGGTKEEMQRLIDDANKLNAAQGKATNYSIDSFADITAAIHDIQTELGVTGTSAKEAASTIQGSVNMLKASWANLVTGLGDPSADIEQLANDVLDSIKAVTGNVVPLIERLLPNISSAITGLASSLVPQLLSTVNNVLPQFIDGIIGAIKALYETIKAETPQIIKTASDILISLAEGIVEAIPIILDAVMEIIAGLVQFLADSAPELVPVAVDFILTIYDTIIDNLPMLLDAGLALILALVEGIINALPDLLNGMNDLVEKVIRFLDESFPKLVETVWQILVAIVSALVGWIGEKAPDVINKVGEEVESVLTKIGEYITKFNDKAKEAVDALKQGFESKKKELVDKVKSLATASVNAAGENFKKIKDKIVQPFNNALNAVKNVMSKIKNTVGGIKLSLPHIKLPHFSVKGGEAPYGIGGKGSLPKMSISWYARGGVFDSPTLFPYFGGIGGLGEAGAEAIVPLERNTYWLDKMGDRVATRIEQKQAAPNIIINIEGARYSNERELASAVSIELQRQLNRKVNAYV